MAEDERVRAQYDKLSGAYDDVLAAQTWWARLACKVVWGFPDTAYTERLLEYLPDDFSGRLLDVPVGTGLFTSVKYHRMPQAQITCLDYSDGMLDTARQRFVEAGVENVTLCQGDAGALPFDSEGFDAILSMNGFHAFPDKEAAFAELHRVLRPGGLFVGCFYIEGAKRRTDWFIRRVYVPGGWFAPPFMTKHDLESKLSDMYSQVELWNVGAIAGFRCLK
jgi:ubiquinone/menaquinone biosynthesis C-methylase UbiE